MRSSTSLPCAIVGALFLSVFHWKFQRLDGHQSGMRHRPICWTRWLPRYFPFYDSILGTILGKRVRSKDPWSTVWPKSELQSPDQKTARTHTMPTSRFHVCIAPLLMSGRLQTERSSQCLSGYSMKTDKRVPVRWFQKRQRLSQRLVWLPGIWD